MKKLLSFISYFLSLFFIATALWFLRIVIDILNPAACNNIWGSNVCPTLVASAPYANYIPFAILAGSIILSFVFYKLAKHLSK